MSKAHAKRLNEIEALPTLRQTVREALRFCAELEDDPAFQAQELRVGLRAMIGHECALFIAQPADDPEYLAGAEAFTLRRIREALARRASLLSLSQPGETDIERTQHA